MSRWACAKGPDRKGHREEWSDRHHGDDQDPPWHRGAPDHHMRWDTESTGDRDPDHRDGGDWLRDWVDQDSDGTDGLIAMLGGAAMAAGDASSAIGLLEMVTWDTGFYSIATGQAVFEAFAWSAAPGGAAAVADVFLEIAGADFIFQREIEASAFGPNEAWAYSAVDYVAIDFHSWSPRHGPIVIAHGTSLEVDADRLGMLLSGFTGAAVAAAAESYGAETLSATFTDALAVENQFSFVQAVGLVAV